jgi:hypothetical protein
MLHAPHGGMMSHHVDRVVVNGHEAHSKEPRLTLLARNSSEASHSACRTLFSSLWPDCRKVVL